MKKKEKIYTSLALFTAIVNILGFSASISAIFPVWLVILFGIEALLVLVSVFLSIIDKNKLASIGWGVALIFIVLNIFI
ncbi:MAG: hypothetical protein GF370_01025 [Candidatus Nealsonbacteria bacterium]|nr:hypothetical protein [Candidatus Nealsonbacteria bacterium]